MPKVNTDRPTKQRQFVYQRRSAKQWRRLAQEPYWAPEQAEPIDNPLLRGALQVALTFGFDLPVHPCRPGSKIPLLQD
jgi:hypothetical protein